MKKIAAERQKEIVAACRAAMPLFLDPLWETILHAPNVALADVSQALENTLPTPTGRIRVVLEWFAHSDSCPVCYMLTGKLILTVPEPVGLIAELIAERVAESEDPDLVRGARQFVDTQLVPRHALAVGISRERLAELQTELRALPAQIREALGVPDSQT